MVKDIYLFRHGESTYNVNGYLQGQTNDSVLTNLGKEQASKAGELLKDKSIELIVSSPLTRARETAQIVSEKINADVIYDECFIEVNVGVVEGLHYTEVLEKYGELYKQWKSFEPQYREIHFDGGETKNQVRKRVFDGLKKYASSSDYKTIAVSGHGIILGQTLVALGIEDMEIPNAAIIHLKFNHGEFEYVGFVE